MGVFHNNSLNYIEAFMNFENSLKILEQYYVESHPNIFSIYCNVTDKILKIKKKI